MLVRQSPQECKNISKKEVELRYRAHKTQARHTGKQTNKHAHSMHTRHTSTQFRAGGVKKVQMVTAVRLMVAAMLMVAAAR